jgi:DNA-binding CsgD family transcriptional regulator
VPSADRGGGDLWRTLRQPAELSQSLVRVAEARLARGDRAGGAEPLLREVDTIGVNRRAGRLRHSPPAAGCAGRRHRRRWRSPRGSTTCCGLVADGKTNRQIAAELFISANTAGVHVSRILAKLGVATRTEAARKLLDTNASQSHG